MSEVGKEEDRRKEQRENYVFRLVGKEYRTLGR